MGSRRLNRPVSTTCTGQAGGQLSQGRTSLRLGGPLLRLLLRHFLTFLQPQILRDALFRSAECLNGRWADSTVWKM